MVGQKRLKMGKTLKYAESRAVESHSKKGKVKPKNWYRVDIHYDAWIPIMKDGDRQLEPMDAGDLRAVAQGESCGLQGERLLLTRTF